MFCGFCSNDQEEDNEIVIRSTNINDFNQRVNRNQVGQVMSLVETSCQYSMVYPSKYDFHINQCALNASKFTDPDFPPNETSIGMSIQNRRVIWKRVTEIVKTGHGPKSDRAGRCSSGQRWRLLLPCLNFLHRRSPL